MTPPDWHQLTPLRLLNPAEPEQGWKLPDPLKRLRFGARYASSKPRATLEQKLLDSDIR